MAIDLVHNNPKTVEEVKANVNAIAEVGISKQVVNVDVSSISAEMTDPDSEKLRKVLLNLINNFKQS